VKKWIMGPNPRRLLNLELNGDNKVGPKRGQTMRENN
jgi:hypothetical protein